jgi:hypothetical protein
LPTPEKLSRDTEQALSDKLTLLFDDPKRLTHTVWNVAGLRFDFSKTHLTMRAC